MIARKAGGTAAWPKVHLIYFLLAAFDLMAVGGGLYLSHRLSSVFEESVATNQEWGQRFARIWSLGDLAAAVNAPTTNVFQSKDAAAERVNLDRAAKALEDKIEAVRREIAANVPAEIAEHPLRSLTNVDQAFATMVANGQRALADYGSGDMMHTAQSMALSQKSFAMVKGRLNNAAEVVRGIEGDYADQFGAQVQSLKRYEYLIGGGIVLMVGCVVCYGHWVGRLMMRKFLELQRANAETGEFAAQLQSVNDDVVKLNRDLEENLTKLRDAQDELVRKGRLSQLGELTATVAHELRNPLGAVRTSAFLLERKLKGRSLGVEAQLDRINNGVTRCDDIITQLLDFSRTKSLNCDLLDLDEWLAKLVEEEAAKLPEAVSVECHLGLDARTLRFDPARLGRALINLMANASEAMVGKGTDPAKFATAAPRIVVATAATARGIEISIADNGPGIDPENLSRILDPLFTTKSFGTGLGLPAVEKIVEQHGGRLEIISKPGEGARFTAILPAEELKEEAA